MRYYVIIFISFLFSVNGIHAQPPTEYQKAILKATVLTGETPAINIAPNSAVFCFDKQIKITITRGSSTVEQCLYFNTTDGYVGYLNPGIGTPATLCDIRPDEKNFHFFIIGLKGNIYTYYNQEGKNGIIDPWVSTGNTEMHPYELNTENATAILHRKPGINIYCGGRVKAWNYKFDGGAADYYLFGKTFPPDIKISANKYLGNFGIGYQQTDKGLYIIMSKVVNNYRVSIADINEVHACFDPSYFQNKEEAFLSKTSDALQKEKEKIDREEAEIKSDDECAGHRIAIIRYKRSLYNTHAANEWRIKQGNTYQDKNAQTSYVDMMNPLQILQGEIYNIQLKICNTEAALRKDPSSRILNDKLHCLNEQLQQMQAAEQTMVEIDARYARGGRASAEKSRIYMQYMRTMIQCK